jgi:ribosome-binding factor A
MKPYSRKDRVGGQIQKVLTEVLRKKIKDPRLQQAVITEVSMSRDLKTARIYFTTFGGMIDAKEMEDGFMSAVGYLKRVLASSLGLRYMPKLTFHHDGTIDYGANIDNLLKQIENENGNNHTETETE